MRVKLARDDVKWLREARWRGRTDTLWLANEVLGYRDICESFHRPMIDFLQPFPMPTIDVALQADKITETSVEYTPWLNLYNLPHDYTRRLLIDQRGSMKTTLNCMVHTIQWILNFPDIAVGIFQANLDKGRDILREIKGHFQFNEVFREIYPDYCPQRRVDDWGTQDSFLLPNRTKIRKEPTVKVASIEKGAAGSHFDIMKFSDIVDESNSETETQLKKITSAFFQRENLLVKLEGWIDVEGTRYDYQDLYGVIIDRWLNLDGKSPDYQKHWKVFLRGCYLREDVTYTPLDLAKEYRKDDKGKRVPAFPERFPLEALERQEAEDPIQFANQRLQDPSALEGEQTYFPFHKFRTISQQDFAKVPVAFYTVTVDTASTQNQRSHNSVITTCAWDWAGRCYVRDVRLGKLQQDEIIHHLFDLHKRFKPTDIAIEETEYVKGMKPALARYQDTMKIYLPLKFIPRDTNLSKQDRIRNTLRPWWMLGEIIFLDNLSCLEHIKTELKRFPKWMDDFLDTLADQFQTREWFGRLGRRPETFEPEEQMVTKVQKEVFNRWISGKTASQADIYVAPKPVDPYFSRTGGL